MTLGTWEPAADAASKQLEPEPGRLQQFIGFSRQGQLDQLDSLLTGDECQTLAGLMKVDHELWSKAAESLSADELQHLIRFFAVAEKLPGWEAGARSPVIPLARTLRGRGEKLPRELLQWLKQVSDNRYLPYGPL